MAVYLITGKMGSGKSLATVGRIRDYIAQGRKVATNLDINLDVMCRPGNKTTITRLPDKPTVQDLEVLGRGQDGIEEEKNGGIFLDELGMWLNAREWADKGRQEFINWLLHARKLGWDLFFIIQDISLIDKQVRTAIIEHLVICKRLDRLSIPGLTPLIKFLTGYRLKPPKIHVGIVKYGCEQGAPVVDRWTYMAKDLYPAYDTKQAFRNPDHPDYCQVHSVLSAWHLKGRYLPAKVPFKERLLEVYKLALLYAVKRGWMDLHEAFTPKPQHLAGSKIAPDLVPVFEGIYGRLLALGCPSPVALEKALACVR